jgi:hypothetical protein
VYLVDVDPDSPARGTRHPLRLKFTAAPAMVIGPNWLAALPYPGFPLREGTTYALVVTEPSTAPIGSVADGADADFTAVLTPAAGASDPAIARAQERYAPFLDWLDEPGGDERADVVSAAVFTTQSATAHHGPSCAPRRCAACRRRPRPTSSASPPSVVPYAIYNGTFPAPELPDRRRAVPRRERRRRHRDRRRRPAGRAAHGVAAVLDHRAHRRRAGQRLAGGDLRARHRRRATSPSSATAPRGRLAAQGLACDLDRSGAARPAQPRRRPRARLLQLPEPRRRPQQRHPGRGSTTTRVVRLLEGLRISETEPERRTRSPSTPPSSPSSATPRAA